MEIKRGRKRVPNRPRVVAVLREYNKRYNVTGAVYAHHTSQAARPSSRALMRLFRCVYLRWPPSLPCTHASIHTDESPQWNRCIWVLHETASRAHLLFVRVYTEGGARGL